MAGLDNRIKVDVFEFETGKLAVTKDSLSSAANWLKLYGKNINYYLNTKRPIEHAETKKKYLIKEKR